MSFGHSSKWAYIREITSLVYKAAKKADEAANVYAELEVSVKFVKKLDQFMLREILGSPSVTNWGNLSFLPEAVQFSQDKS